MTQFVYVFGGDKTEGSAAQKNLLGGKGANLAEMASLGLPVPAGFTISTDMCTTYYDNGKTYPKTLDAEVKKALKHIESAVGKSFGDDNDPLLVSVRSGARVSMPGMMDTVLNLGLNDKTVEGLAKKSGDARFAYDSYRRFIQMYGDVVMGVDHYEFEDVLDTHKRNKQLKNDTQIDATGWKKIITDYKEIITRFAGHPFPQDPHEQLWGAISAVFNSWEIPRAVTYRKINDIPSGWGTAVNVQAMVFGNMGSDCATGVAFTRDPSTGENVFYGEYLINAQGEDVVAGIRTPLPIVEMKKTMPAVYDELLAVREKLESHYCDMQDIEFTVQQNKLYMLQTRSGKRSAAAALKIAVDLVKEKRITQDEALMLVSPESLDQLLHPTLDPKATKNVLGTGLPASPGAATGQVCFSPDEAEELSKKDIDVILCRTETSPEDIHGMHAAKGILTTRGGMTSHAAVVARGMGRPCVAGAGTLAINDRDGVMIAGDKRISAGEIITLDGSTGEVMLGQVATQKPNLSGDFETIMAWADKARRMNVRTNADTPEDVATALGFGAEGIGLCRTEHMFFDADRIQAVREMIFANSTDGRRKALAKIEPYQVNDFKAIFKGMDGLPVTVRLLDPPLHEFLPHKTEDVKLFADNMNLNIESVRSRLAQLHESNPMLGHRGCRLGITYPEIYEMQVRAIIMAALDVQKTGTDVRPEIMIPLISSKNEMTFFKDMSHRVAKELIKQSGQKLNYMVGTMIELPRAALRANHIAEDAEFFSFGTNDLTQTTLGLSRDDAGHFLPEYVNKGIYPRDPFVSLDIDGVGQLVDMAVQKGRATRPDIKLGICGEHGGDPSSIMFFDSVGLDYVSCSPYRVPIARLAAAQASITHNKEKITKLKKDA